MVPPTDPDAVTTDRYRLGTMVPPSDALPDVLPTERLMANGMAVPTVRAELRRIPDWRSALAVAAVAAEVVVVVGAAIWLSHPVVWVVAFVLMARSYARINSLGHEAVHRTLFSNPRVNDLVGKWALTYPAWVPFEIYKRSHINHHRDELGPKEPDLPLYAGYPVSPASMRRKLTRDAFGVTGWRQLKGLVRGLRNERARPAAIRILACQVVILALFTAIGRPELYLFLWFLPWMTGWRVINRLRAIAEHAGMERSPDRRRTTHSVRQSRLAGFWIVPFNIGYHLAHHVDMGVPLWNLPAMHRELVDAGWVTDAYEWPTYRACWRALASG